MKVSAPILFFFILILAIGYMEQHAGSWYGSILAGQELSSHAESTGNFCSHDLIHAWQVDDMISESPEIADFPDLILLNGVAVFTPAPVFADPSPCWQPPEFRS